MLNAFFKARPRLRVALLGLAICAPSMAVGVSAALAQDAARLTVPATTPFVSDRLSVEVIGQGPDVILIPGFGCSREVWRVTAERLKATHRVHLVQLAGFAGEPWSHGDGPFVQLRQKFGSEFRHQREGAHEKCRDDGHQRLRPPQCECE